MPSDLYVALSGQMANETRLARRQAPWHGADAACGDAGPEPQRLMSCRSRARRGSKTMRSTPSAPSAPPNPDG